MNMDSITSVYSDTRTEYTKQLCIFLIPAYFQFFVDLLGKAKQGSEPKKVLWQFQTMLNEIHDWNMEKVHNEINTIHGNTGCDYLEDLLTAVFIAHTKVLTAIRLSANNKKVEITIPKVEHFLFKVLCEISKLLWSSTYLFREDISGIDRQQNYKLIEGIIGEGILQAIRSLVPVKSILKNLVNQEETKETKETDKEDSDDEDIAVKPQAESESQPLAPLAPLVPLESQPKSILSTVKNALDSAKSDLQAIQSEMQDGSDLPLVELNEVSESPQVINLDEKPSVSFAKYNTIFSSENPDESNMVEEDKSPDLEILDTVGSALNNNDFDQLDDDSEILEMDDYEVIS
jgi:hypothetical protein